ncbi:MAG: 50S ribosomal protein L21 [Gemmatimonadales bacterium]
MYAIFKALGKQWRAETGATIRLPLMAEKSPGDKLVFNDVLLGSSGDTVTAGTPMISGASVSAEVVGHGQEAKIYVFKFKRRKGYRRKTGHRQKYTEVRITDVVLG